jgi:hypothetical protein
MAEIWKNVFTRLLRIHYSFLHIFLDFFQIFENFKIWIQKSPISNLELDRSRRILENAAKFFNPDCG